MVHDPLFSRNLRRNPRKKIDEAAISQYLRRFEMNLDPTCEPTAFGLRFTILQNENESKTYE